MEKVIKLVMYADKSIKIFINDEEKHTIDLQNRSISATKVYEIISFIAGDHYNVLSENPTGTDNQVLEFFTGLFKDIVEKVNQINVDSKGSENTGAE